MKKGIGKAKKKERVLSSYQPLFFKRTMSLDEKMVYQGIRGLGISSEGGDLLKHLKTEKISVLDYFGIVDALGKAVAYYRSVQGATQIAKFKEIHRDFRERQRNLPEQHKYTFGTDIDIVKKNAVVISSFIEQIESLLKSATAESPLTSQIIPTGEDLGGIPMDFAETLESIGDLLGAEYCREGNRSGTKSIGLTLPFWKCTKRVWGVCVWGHFEWRYVELYRLSWSVDWRVCYTPLSGTATVTITVQIDGVTLNWSSTCSNVQISKSDDQCTYTGTCDPVPVTVTWGGFTIPLFLFYWTNVSITAPCPSGY